MLVCYARELKHAFVNYVEETVKIMVPLLKFYFHDAVRTAAAESLPYLLECAKVRGNHYVNEMWNYIFPDLIKAVESEPEKEVLCELMTSLSSVCSQVAFQFAVPRKKTDQTCSRNSVLIDVIIFSHLNYSVLKRWAKILSTINTTIQLCKY